MGVVKRARGETAATNLAVDLAAVKVHAQWWPSDLKPRMAALPNQIVEGSDETVSAWVAGECNRILGQELTVDEELTSQELAREGKTRELEARKKFKVFLSAREGDISKKVIDSKWALTWKMVGGI